MKEKRMNKKIFSTLLLYLVITLIGTAVMSFPAFGYFNPIYYASILFYAFAFFNVIAYFYGKSEKQDYELLYFCLINIISASYLFISEYSEAPFTLGTAFLIYTLLVAGNRGYHTYILKKKKDTLWVVRALSTILILFLGILTIQNFYRDLTDVQTLMIGYYFITFGIVSVLETLIIGFISSSTFEKILNGDFESLKENRKNKPIKRNKNENIKELDEIVKNIEAPKKKKKKVKKSLKK